MLGFETAAEAGNLDVLILLVPQELAQLRDALNDCVFRNVEAQGLERFKKQLPISLQTIGATAAPNWDAQFLKMQLQARVLNIGEHRDIDLLDDVPNVFDSLDLVY